MARKPTLRHYLRPHIAKGLMVTNGAFFSSRKEMFLKSQTIFLIRKEGENIIASQQYG